MRVLLLGANGRTGREITKQSLSSGFDVTAVVRSTSSMPLELARQVDVRIANACSAEALRPLVPGHDVVISVLGPRWPTRKATSVYPRSAAAIVGAMEGSDCRRLLVTSSALLFPLKRRGDRLLKRLVPRVVESASEMERTIIDSDLEWTIARTSFLSNAEVTAARVMSEQEVADQAPRGAVARKAAAHYLLEEAQAGRNRRQIVGLFGGEAHERVWHMTGPEAARSADGVR